ncbi:40S ribosomal protein SA [Camelus dromedarius]|uniref:40S ribosomal protein SA n=1 Tax=Camelus dromedarius TaxID=9838 RepID=A0A5N4D5T0_CAMDR|nr:40S ribosomal protein SA [Camelus dromedarius]
MSGALDVLQMKEEDVLKFLAAGTHLDFWWLPIPGLTTGLSPSLTLTYLPTIALCNTDSPLRYVDIAILCNNKGAHSVGLMWMLAREVLHMRGTISREHLWEVVPDLCFYRDPEEIEKEEQAAAEKAVTKEEFQGEWMAPAPEFTATQPEVADWSEGVQVPSGPIQQFPTEDWSAHWSAAPTAQAAEWVATTTEWS